MFTLPGAVALGLAAAVLPAQPGRAQAGAGPGGAPDASAFQRGPWAELGELGDGAVLSISEARYREGSVLTFALRTAFASGDEASTVEVIELDCATARFRRTSASALKRNGEMSGSNEPGAFAAYPEDSVIGELGAALCAGASGG